MSERAAILVRLLKKDTGYVRARAVACWVLVASMWIWPWMFGWAEAAPIHLGLGLFMPLLVLGGLLQQDLAIGGRGFWITRPLSPGLLLTSKALVALAWVILPCAVIQTVPLAFMGLSLEPRDYVLVFASRLAYFAMGACLLVTAAALTRRLTEMGVLAAGLLAGAVVVAAVFTRLVPEAFGADRMSFTMALPVLLVIQNVLFLGVLYKTRRLPMALAALALSGLAILGLGRTWQWDLVRPLAAVERPPAPPRRSDWPIQVHVAEEAPARELHSKARVDRLSVTVEGLPEGVSLVQRGYAVRVRRGGEQASSPYYFSTSERQHDWPLVGPRAIPATWEAALGCAPARPVRGSVEVFRQLPEGGPPALEAPYSLSGTLQFDVVRSAVSRRAGVSGGVLPFAGGRWITDRIDEGGETTLIVRSQTVGAFPFLPPWRRADGHERISPVLVDSQTDECLKHASSSSRGSVIGVPFLPLQTSETRYSGWAPSGRPGHRLGPLPETAQLVVVTSQTIGILDVPFEIAVPGTK